LKTANSGYLTRRLVDVTQDLVVTEDDCGTGNGVAMKALVEGGEVIEALRDRVLGRVTTTDVMNPDTQDVLYPAGKLLDEDAVEQIEALGIDEVKVRTPLTCETRYGLCASATAGSRARPPREPWRGRRRHRGAVDRRARHPAHDAHVPHRRRGVALGSVDSEKATALRFTSTMRYVTNAKGEPVAIGRSGEVTIVDDNGRERERHKVPYGATLLAADGKQVRAGMPLASWDPLTRPIITEYAGTVKFEHVEEGVTVAKQSARSPVLGFVIYQHKQPSSGVRRRSSC
jgi:DNA-directed RNA polymerase subunit beta'